VGDKQKKVATQAQAPVVIGVAASTNSAILTQKQLNWSFLPAMARFLLTFYLALTFVSICKSYYSSKLIL
jgi:hypothetical protein